MQSRPLVTVAIPAYNVEAYIAEALQSLQAQSFTDYEAIIVDDGSTDGTYSAAKPFLEDSRLQYIRLEQNRGVGQARNEILRLSKGEWIALLDADDIWIPTKLEQQLLMAQSDPQANLIYSNIVAFYPNGRQVEAFKQSELPEGDITAALYAKNYLSTSSVMVRADDLRQIGGFSNLKLAEDYHTWLKLSRRGIWAKKCSGPTVHYRVRAGSQQSACIHNLELVLNMLEDSLRHEQRDAYRSILIKHIGRVKAKSAYLLAADSVVRDRKLAGNYLFEAWRRRPTALKWLIMATICHMGIGSETVTRRLAKNLELWSQTR